MDSARRTALEGLLGDTDVLTLLSQVREVHNDLEVAAEIGGITPLELTTEEFSDLKTFLLNETTYTDWVPIFGQSLTYLQNDDNPEFCATLCLLWRRLRATCKSQFEGS